MKMKMVYTAVSAVGLIGVGFLSGTDISLSPGIPKVVTKTVEVMAPPPEKVQVSKFVIVEAMEKKYQLTTASANLQTYLEAGRCDGNWWQDMAYRDCLKMDVPAKVNAGFGQNIIDEKRITATPETVTIDLGTPIIHDVVINHARIKVRNPDDEGGFWSDADKNLQARALAKTETTFRRLACEAGIFQQASLSAEKQYGDHVRHILSLAGDTRTVHITYDVPTCTT